MNAVLRLVLFSLLGVLAISTVGLAEEVKGEVQYRGNKPVQFTVDTILIVGIDEVDKNGMSIKNVALMTAHVKELPQTFVIDVDRNKLQSGRTYLIGAQLKQRGKIIFASRENPPAIVDGEPATDVKIEVAPK